MSKSDKERLGFCLFLLRAGVFVVMLPWTLDKFVRPEHTEKVFQNFYHFPALGPVYSYAIGALQLILVLAFAIGVRKRLTYGLILILHSVSTFSSYQQYFAPFQGANLLFFAAWPMLGACVTLFLLRDQDTWLTVSK